MSDTTAQAAHNAAAKCLAHKLEWMTTLQNVLQCGRLRDVSRAHLAGKLAHVALPHNRAMDSGRGSGRLPTRLSSLCVTAGC